VSAHSRSPSIPEQSAALRETLLIAVGNITSADLAADWAREAAAMYAVPDGDHHLEAVSAPT
jgi:hypothetical protein